MRWNEILVMQHPCEPVRLVVSLGHTRQQKRILSSYSMSTPLRDSRWFMFAIVLALWVSASAAFQVTMSTGDAYKPPVKSSVEKMYDRRYGETISSSRSSNPAARHQRRSSDDRRTSSAKAAHAGTLAMPQARSFEQRMRDMVLGTPATTTSHTVAPTTVGPIQERQQQRALPPNVLTIETLQDYKRVVGDEREKIVAVRFYATYCKVSVLPASGRQTVRPLYERVLRSVKVIFSLLSRYLSNSTGL